MMNERINGFATEARETGPRGLSAGKLPPALLRLLAKRGYRTEEEIEAFLHPGIDCFHSPFLLKDMDRAAARVNDALEKGEKILVYGDYDADGVTSTSLLIRYFRGRGADPAYYIPDRLTEGYGVNEEAVGSFAAAGVKLIVTVDTGCTAANEIAKAKELGIDVVVTDHHECLSELPVCAAVVDPMRPDCPYPFKGLAGVGVAFKLICALERIIRPDDDENELYAGMLERCADVVAVGTVADVMPLTDENRLIVKKGLELLERGAHEGLAALLAEARRDKTRKEPVNAQTVGFLLAPRINAAGRMGSVSAAIDLFTSDDRAAAVRNALTLCALNEARRAEENRIMEDVTAMLSGGSREGDPFLVLHGENWHEGVIGIVASRLLESTGKPVVLLTGKEVCRGSGRSPAGCDLTKLLSANAPLLEKFGGHEQAAGLTIREENIEAFRRAANAFAGECAADDRAAGVRSDMTLAPGELTVALARSLHLLEPFGNGNPAPCFTMGGVLVCDVIALSGGKHTKLIVGKGGLRFQALYFGCTPESLPVCPGSEAEVFFELSVNEYGGNLSVQLTVRGILPSAEQTALEKAEYAEYLAVKNDEDRPVGRELLPAREDFVVLYKYLAGCASRNSGRVSAFRAAYDCAQGSIRKLFLMLDVLSEAGLIGYRATGTEPLSFTFGLLETRGKADLNSTPLMISLYNRSNKL